MSAVSVLRDYQSKIVSQCRQSLGMGNTRPLIQSPTGSGKTITATAIAELTSSKGNRVQFWAPRRELVLQTSAVWEKFGIKHGVLMAGEPWRTTHRHYVCSVHTLASRVDKGLPPADVIIIDEAHIAVTPMYEKLLALYPEAVVIGFSATPSRENGKGMAAMFDDLIDGPSVQMLTDAGHLVPVRYFAPSTADLSEVSIRGGDYAKGELSAAADQVALRGDVVENWARIAEGKRTVVYAVDRKHGRALRTDFAGAGVAVEYIDGETPDEDRTAILKRLETGETTVVVNVFVLAYGWDMPALECAVLARPTKSLTLYLQMVGRVMRPSEGKAEALLLDHGGIVSELGFAADHRTWELTHGKEKKKTKPKPTEPKKLTCDNCASVYRAAPSCPSCGFKTVIEYERAIEAHQAELAEIDRKTGKSANKEVSWEDKQSFIAQLKGYGDEKGYKSGWAANKYREKFGVWPNDARVSSQPPKPCGAEVRRWLKSSQIRYAKAQEKERAAA